MPGMKCPDPDCCKELIEKLNEVGICASKKIPKLWGFIFITAFGVSLVTGGYKLYSGVQAGEIMHQQNVKQIAENAEQIEKLVDSTQECHRDHVVTRERIININKNLEDIKQAVEKIADEHKH